MSEDFKNKAHSQEIQESFLSLRKPSNTEDEKFISGISSSYEAAKLRSASKTGKPENFHSPVKFSWSAFWKSLIYENLPPVVFSPLAALIMEGSMSRAWHVMNNRGLLAVSTKHHPLLFIIQSWLIIYPASWLMNIGLFLALFSDIQVIANIDPFHMILAYLLLFMRRLIIATKYGYFRPEDLERLCLPAPDWDNDKTIRRLVGQGWLRPYNFPGIIEDELTVAMDENDTCLQAIPLEFDDETSKQLRNEPFHPLFPPKTSATDENQIASGFILHKILKSVYDFRTFKFFEVVMYSTIMIMVVTPFLSKFLYGGMLFGETIQEKIISSATLIGFANGFQLLMFGLVCSIDYERRFKTANKLGQMVAYPGLAFAELMRSSGDLKKNSVYLDLQKRLNVFGWMNIRKVMRSFGEAFFLRVQGYTSILVLYSLLCVAVLNIIIWTEMRHHISTIYVIVAIGFLISSISLFSIYKAIKLQSLSAEHRDFVRNEIFIIEEEIWELKLKGEHDDRITDLQSAKALLEQVDESINYKELIYKPTTILGYPAHNGVIGSILGLVLTGFLFAVQGFVSTGIEYDASGWFLF